MSKIGNKTIVVKPPTTVEINHKTVKVKGTHGELVLEVPLTIDVSIKDNVITVKRLNEDKKVKSLHGLYRQLISNAVDGVEKMWEKNLEVVGTGYNVKLQGEDLVFKVGYIHPVIFKKVPNIKFVLDGANKVKVLGVDKQLVGQIAYQIKLIKKPDVYKGKGIKYQGEKLRIKPGKKAKAAGAA